MDEVEQKTSDAMRTLEMAATEAHLIASIASIGTTGQVHDDRENTPAQEENLQFIAR